MTTLRPRRAYDHRIREMICETGDPDLFRELKIPRSTIRSWLHRGIPDVVTFDPLSAETTELRLEIQELRHRAAVLVAIVGLLVAMLRLSERGVDPERLTEGNGKRTLLRASERVGWYRWVWRCKSHGYRRLVTTAGAAPRLVASLMAAPAVREASRLD